MTDYVFDGTITGEFYDMMDGDTITFTASSVLTTSRLVSAYDASNITITVLSENVMMGPSATLASIFDTDGGNTIFIGEDVDYTGSNGVSIFVNDGGVGSTFINYGSITATTFGAINDPGIGSVIENYGYINGDFYGARGGENASILNAGTIVSPWHAIIARQGSVVRNTGMIESQDLSGILMNDNDNNDGPVSGRIINSGEINGGDYGVFAIRSDDVRVTNTGTISAESFGVWFNGAMGAVTLINRGTISNEQVAGTSNYAVLFSQFSQMLDPSIRLVNRGELLGDVQTDDGNDVYDGRSGVISGLISLEGGDDLMQGGGGTETVNGGDGNDRLNGYGGDDVLFGEDGEDVLFGGQGADVLRGGDDNDRLYGDNGADELYGGLGDDYLNGGLKDDRLFGDGGNDTLFGKEGRDRLEGGDGDDSLFGGDRDDRLFGQNGDDNLVGGAGNDLLIGGNGNDRLRGNDGNDDLRGKDGDDVLIGAAGDDILNGSSGDDTLRGGEGDDRLNGGDGDDRAYFTDDFAAYSITQRSNGSLEIEHLGGSDGTDIVSNVETLIFADGAYAVEGLV